MKFELLEPKLMLTQLAEGTDCYCSSISVRLEHGPDWVEGWVDGHTPGASCFIKQSSIDWGDGSPIETREMVHSQKEWGFRHQYMAIGTYTMVVRGDFFGGPDLNQILEFEIEITELRDPPPPPPPIDPLDFNGDGTVDHQDVRDAAFDTEAGEILDLMAAFDIHPGDSDMNKTFNSGDLVLIFQRGKYETDEPASWVDGDFNGDGRFNSTDLVFAFREGYDG